jgi:SPP1 family predicted phage head-tail adaptor
MRIKTLERRYNLHATFLTPTETVNACGDVVTTWAPPPANPKGWCVKKPLTGALLFAAMQQQSKATWQFETRFRTDVSAGMGLEYVEGGATHRMLITSAMADRATDKLLLDCMEMTPAEVTR